eukprot:CAMPEP_0174380268 /NCGR_PEP_ID=MMETSP0811_2-20130205/123261_1 /TAXON_ID=73025 ORGANISM="Eutreptiella gymnastica-like, Strain CCMP1594" /NCGR_SAMPLE_ID=MMETSP0811_2 /ASSEMBLY_ACC=CAM_ASM_000667 /LENGTH=292 /DNA_ID=CAMNT_0015533077 /DNA_START=1640 /DNA_END=2519 /DNA_ORIENTATION=+
MPRPRTTSSIILPVMHHGAILITLCLMQRRTAMCKMPLVNQQAAAKAACGPPGLCCPWEVRRQGDPKEWICSRVPLPYGRGWSWGSAAPTGSTEGGAKWALAAGQRGCRGVQTRRCDSSPAGPVPGRIRPVSKLVGDAIVLPLSVLQPTTTSPVYCTLSGAHVGWNASRHDKMPSQWSQWGLTMAPAKRGIVRSCPWVQGSDAAGGALLRVWTIGGQLLIQLVLQYVLQNVTVFEVLHLHGRIESQGSGKAFAGGRGHSHRLHRLQFPLEVNTKLLMASEAQGIHTLAVLKL